MIKIKFCGLTRPCDSEAANAVKPDYVGFVFFEKSKRFVTGEQAAQLRKMLDSSIKTVGVFIDEDIKKVDNLLKRGIIDIAQLHGCEDDIYIERLREMSGKPVIKAFQVRGEKELAAALKSSADYILLDAGTGDGKTFDWKLLENFGKPYFLAGGLNPDNVGEAVKRLRPYALDVSSGIETDGVKDKNKMAAFAAIVRKEDKR